MTIDSDYKGKYWEMIDDFDTGNNFIIKKHTIVREYRGHSFGLSKHNNFNIKNVEENNINVEIGEYGVDNNLIFSKIFYVVPLSKLKLIKFESKKKKRLNFIHFV